MIIIAYKTLNMGGSRGGAGVWIHPRKSQVDIGFLRDTGTNSLEKQLDQWHSLSVPYYDARKPVFGVCEEQKRRPACASAQTDQRLCHSLIVKYHV